MGKQIQISNSWVIAISVAALAVVAYLIFLLANGWWVYNAAQDCRNRGYTNVQISSNWGWGTVQCYR